MNKIVFLFLLGLVVVMSHTYANVTLRPAKQSVKLLEWIKTCKAFGKQTPDLKQFFGCPTGETFTFSDKASAQEVTAAVNAKLDIKAIDVSRRSGAPKFLNKFRDDFSANYDLVREVEEGEEEIRFNKGIEKQFSALADKLEKILLKESSLSVSFYDKKATWTGNFDGKPVEAEALVLVDMENQSVSIYRLGYYWNTTI